MVNTHYIPAKGDIVWLNFRPQSGREQSGRRPAVVISPLEYNKKVGLAIFCPITSQIKGYPFEVLLPDNYLTKGAIIADQIKSLDWQSRNAEFIEAIDSTLFEEISNKLKLLIF